MVLSTILATGLWAQEKSPPRALLSSLLIPGGGQFYCENRTKGVFFFLVQTFFLAATILEHQSTEDYHQRYLQTQDSEDYEEYRKHVSRRSDLLWMGGLCYAISAADAYVSAHFYGFEVARTVKLALLKFQF